MAGGSATLSTRPKLRAAVLTVALVALTAVGWRAAAQVMGAINNTLVVLEEELPTQIHPFELFSCESGAHLSSLLYERLVRLDSKANALVPSLIEPLEKRSARQFVTRIRRDVEIKWHDGKPLIPRDVVRSFERLVEMAGEPDAAASTQALADLLLGIRSSEKPGRIGGLEAVSEGEGGELIFDFSRATDEGEALQVLSIFMVLPAHVTDADLKRQAVGLGPFRMAEAYEKGDLLLDRNDNYFRGAPKLRRILVKAEPSAEARLSAALNGEVGVSLGILEPMGRESLAKRTDLRVKPQLSRAFYYMGFNMDTGFQGARFGERDWLREAVSLMIDKQTLLESVARDGQAAALLTGPFRPDSPNASRNVSAVLPNAERAASLFQENGFERVAQFYQDSTGTPVEATLAYDESQPDLKELAERIREQLERSGIAVRLAPRSRRDFDALLAGEDRRFDLVVHRWNIDEDEELYDVYHSKGVYNFLRYRSERADKVIEFARNAFSPASRMHYHWQLHETLAQDRPAVFLWSPKVVAIFDARVSNVPILDPYYFYRDVHKWEFKEIAEPMQF